MIMIYFIIETEHLVHQTKSLATSAGRLVLLPMRLLAFTSTIKRLPAQRALEATINDHLAGRAHAFDGNLLGELRDGCLRRSHMLAFKVFRLDDAQQAVAFGAHRLGYGLEVGHEIRHLMQRREEKSDTVVTMKWSLSKSGEKQS